MKEITHEQFCEQVKNLNLKWMLGLQGEIRTVDDRNTCPYLAIPDAEFVDVKKPSDIFAAADNKPGHDVNIRQQLLAACNLS